MAEGTSSVQKWIRCGEPVAPIRIELDTRPDSEDYQRTAGLNNNGTTDAKFGAAQATWRIGGNIIVFANYTGTDQWSTSPLPTNALNQLMQMSASASGIRRGQHMSDSKSSRSPMLGHRELTMEDYADILKRRFWLILTSTIVFLAVGIGVALCHPSKISVADADAYRAAEGSGRLCEAGGRGGSERAPGVDEGADPEPLAHRADHQRFNLFAGGKASMDDRVEMTQKAIGIKPIPSGQSSHGMPGFYITFNAQDAHTAQQVCGEITSLFVSENLNARRAVRRRHDGRS